MPFPRIYLAVDNCFASKRWTEPAEWMRIAADLGLTCVEASADNECDPLYADADYLRDWLAACTEASKETGVRVVNLYSGHGTYATLGLAGTDRRNRDHIQRDWGEVMIRNASQLGAGLGFYCHAFRHCVLQDKQAYEAAESELYDRLAELARYAADLHLPSIGVEQMYAPHQIPWTIAGAERLMKEILARAGAPMYLSLDTGHQIGQRRFLRPTAEQVSRRLEEFRRTGRMGGLWLGPDSAYELFRDAAAAASTDQRNSLVQGICEQMDRYPHLFAEEQDGDLYEWIGRLGCYCPIFHLQQTDGTSSLHWAFTEENNARGIVRGDAVLRALSASCKGPRDPKMPPPCENIYMTIEMFSAITDIATEIISRLEESVAYWRQFVPRDGLRLDELLNLSRRT